MSKEGYSREGIFGEIKHYDAKGHKIGESRSKLLGGRWYIKRHRYREV